MTKIKEYFIVIVFACVVGIVAFLTVRGLNFVLDRIMYGLDPKSGQVWVYSWKKDPWGINNYITTNYVIDVKDGYVKYTNSESPTVKAKSTYWFKINSKKQ